MAIAVVNWTQAETTKAAYVFDFIDVCRAKSGAIVRTVVSSSATAESDLTLGTRTDAPTEVQQLISGGVADTTYKVRCHAVFTDGVEWDIEITVTIRANGV